MSRDAYRQFVVIPTRWADNDVYGHVNNVVHYSWFDTAVNSVLIERGLLDPLDGDTIGLVVETGCRYLRAITFPEVVEAGIRIGRIGSSSIRWEIGLFTAGHDDVAAQGFFIHVYVDRSDRRPRPLSGEWRAALADLSL